MSQSNQILSHLKKSSITPIEALTLYGCFRLAARIYDLKESGHDIQAEIVTDNDHRYARYTMQRSKK